MAPIQDVDPRRLDEAGWGVIFAENVREKVKDALKPLLKQRKDEAGQYLASTTKSSA